MVTYPLDVHPWSYHEVIMLDGRVLNQDEFAEEERDLNKTIPVQWIGHRVYTGDGPKRTVVIWKEIEVMTVYRVAFHVFRK